MERWNQGPVQRKVQQKLPRRSFAVPSASEHQLVRRARPYELPKAMSHAKRKINHNLHIVWPKVRHGTTVLFLVYMAVLSAGVLNLAELRTSQDRYKLAADTQQLLGSKVSPDLAKKLSYDGASQSYQFNPNYHPTLSAVGVGSGEFSASLSQNIEDKGFSLTDPETQISLTLTPEFSTMAGKNIDNRLVYPINQGGSQMVYSVRGNGLKEDIVLPSYQSDHLQFSYKLGLPSGTEARLLPNGGIGVYSADSSLFGNISYGSDKDKQLVQKARAVGQKTNLVFGIPAPEITELKSASKATAKFILKGDQLTVDVQHLKQANYPLSIDPSVVVGSASTFVNGGSAPNLSKAANADSNISFSTSTSPTTSGLTNGTLASFSSSGLGSTQTVEHFSATAVYSNVIYDIAPSYSSGTGTQVFYATINSSTGVVSSFTATSSLTTAAFNTAAVINNGYIYAIGGSTGSASIATVQYAAICTGVNTNGGCTTSSTQGTLGTWATTTSLTTARLMEGAYVMNNHIYAAGGESATTPTYTTSTEYATPNADGTISSWTAGASLGTAVAQFGFASYNNYLYVIGGTNGTVQSSVQYIKVNTDGSMGAWTTTSALPNALFENTAGAIKGYLYTSGGQQVSGGTIQSATFYAPINADGTLGTWNTTTSQGTATATAGGFVYNGWLYTMGGCTNTACVANTSVIQRGVPDTGSGAALLAARQTGTAFPTESTNNGTLEGKYNHGTAVLDGFIYVIGGCVTFSADATCDTSRFTIQNLTSRSIHWAAINSDGTVGTWSTDTTGLPDGNGRAAFGLVAFDDSLFVIGGITIANNLNLTSNWLTTGEYASINQSTGAVGTFTTANNVLPLLSSDGSGFLAATYVNGYIYVQGGCRGTSGFSCSSWAALNCRIQITNDAIPSGSSSANPSCSTTGQTQLTTVLASSSSLFGASATGMANMGVAYGGGYIYLVGGRTNSRTQLRTIVYAHVDPVNGITGSWSIATATLNFPTVSGGTAGSDGVRNVSAAYANGQLLSFGGYNANGSGAISSIVNVCQITPSSGDIASCATSNNALSSTRWSSAAAYSNGYFYDTGGCSAGAADVGCTNIATNVDIYRINYGGPGVANSWSTSSSSMGTARYLSAMAASNGHLYLLGGCTDTTAGCSTPVATVMIGTINGATGSSRVTWASSTSLPASRGGLSAVVENGYLYALGGYNGGSVNNYYYAKLASDGSIISNGVTGCSGGAATWCSASMPASLATFGATVADGKIYIAGGLSGASRVATFYYGNPSITNGSISWTTGTSFTTGRQDLGLTNYNGYIYVAGGYDGTNYLQDIQFAQITNASTGATGSWSYTSNLPQKVQMMNVFAEDGYFIMVGGLQADGTTCNNSIWAGSIASNGEIAPMYKSLNTFTATSWAAATYYDGYIYQAGGICNATDSSATVYAGFAAQPAVGQLSQLLDAGADVTPIEMYVNTSRGSLSSVISVVYTSAADVSNAPLGNNYRTIYDMLDAPANLYAVSAINTSNAITDRNRYYFLQITIDDSQTLAFPTPSLTTLSRYELFYHANTGLRLRGGQTFSNGAASTLDAAP